MKRFQPVVWLLLTGAILLLNFAAGATVFLTVLVFFPVALASWFNGRAWGVALAVLAPLVRLGFHFVWKSSATLGEATLNAGVALVTFSTFAILIDLVARQRAEIRVLKGIVPTCAWCRKVQDGEGCWHQMEAYISERSDAQFSHGICPECAKENFGMSKR